MRTSTERKGMTKIMFSQLALQTPVRGSQYLQLYIPSDMRDFTMDDYTYMEEVLALQMRAIKTMVARAIELRGPDKGVIEYDSWRLSLAWETPEEIEAGLRALPVNKSPAAHDDGKESK